MTNTTSESRILFLSTPVQELLFKSEILGQLSDGYWENSKPFDHWQFWSAVTVTVDDTVEPHLAIGGEASWRAPKCSRTNYGLERLLKFGVVVERMLAMVNHWYVAVWGGRNPTYTAVDLKRDLKAIKLAMRNVKYV